MKERRINSWNSRKIIHKKVYLKVHAINHKVILEKRLMKFLSNHQFNFIILKLIYMLISIFGMMLGIYLI